MSQCPAWCESNGNWKHQSPSSGNITFPALFVSIVGKVSTWLQLNVCIVLSGGNTCFSFCSHALLLSHSPSSSSSFPSHLGFPNERNIATFSNKWLNHFQVEVLIWSQSLPSCSRWLFLCQAHEREQVCDHDGPLPTEVWECSEQCADLPSTGCWCPVGGTHTRQPGWVT